MTSDINTNRRLFDLVRFMRSELHEAELITDEECSWLFSEAPMAKGSGSPSPRRLEDYDKVKESFMEALRLAQDAKITAENKWAGRLQIAVTALHDIARGVDAPNIFAGAALARLDSENANCPSVDIKEKVNNPYCPHGVTEGKICLMCGDRAIASERAAQGPSDATNCSPCPCNHEAQKRDGWKHCGNCYKQFYPEENVELRDRHESATSNPNQPS